MKLCHLVEIATNNEECVILKIKDDARIDLISLGCFDGDEKMLRITKGGKHTATVFTENNHFSWHWGEGGYTIVSEKTSKCGRLIQECVEEDFGIYIGKNKKKINDTLYIQSLGDNKGKECNLKILYWKQNENRECNIHVNDEHIKWFDGVKFARKYIQDRFNIQHQHQYVAGTGCMVEEYKCSYL